MKANPTIYKEESNNDSVGHIPKMQCWLNIRRSNNVISNISKP